MTLSGIMALMPPAFAPIWELHDRSEGRDAPLDWFRVTAFPRYARTSQELERFMEGADAEVILARFRDFLGVIGRQVDAYALPMGAAEHDAALDIDQAGELLENIASRLVENSSMVIIVPGYRCVLSGHDEFGCVCFFERADGNAPTWIAALAHGAGLYCARP